MSERKRVGRKLLRENGGSLEVGLDMIFGVEKPAWESNTGRKRVSSARDWWGVFDDPHAFRQGAHTAVPSEGARGARGAQKGSIVTGRKS